jgi:hypothetical protein
MRISELDLSLAARLCLEVADIHEVNRLLEHGTDTEQSQEYDSCVGRVHTDSAGAGSTRVATGR